MVFGTVRIAVVLTVLLSEDGKVLWATSRSVALVVGLFFSFSYPDLMYDRQANIGIVTVALVQSSIALMLSTI